MHLMNDKRNNSRDDGSAYLNQKLIQVNQSAYCDKILTESEKLTTPTLSADSCDSSTDSGVIITDNSSAYEKQGNQVNDENIINNIKNKYNRTSFNTTNPNSSSSNNNIIDNTNDNNERRHSKDNLNSNKSSTINNQIDNKKRNIENLVDINGQGNAKRRRRYSISSKTSSNNCSPALSIRSNTISIISIDENAIDSSVVDSDSDYEGQHSDYIIKKLGQQTTYEPDHPDLLSINKGMQVLSQTISPGSLPPTTGPLTEKLLNGSTLPTLTPAITTNTAQIGSIALSNSTDVTFGDKHFYEGPVTIQQIVIDNRKKEKNGEYGGKDNPAYCNDASDDPEDHTQTKKVANQHEGPYKCIFNRRAIIITGSIIILTVIIGIIFVTANTLTKQTTRKSKIIEDGDDSRKHIPINSTIGSDNVGGGMILRIVPRDGWLAQPPSAEPVHLATPVRMVIVLSTLTEGCQTQAMCVYRVRMTQTLNIESQNHDDIIYNFLIGGDGNVYEGRGWDIIGAHLRGFNSKSISLAYIGTFKNQNPSAKQMNVTKLLLEEGVRLGKLSSDYQIYGANMLDPTLTDVKADKLYESFENWPHWSG